MDAKAGDATTSQEGQLPSNSPETETIESWTFLGDEQEAAANPTATDQRQGDDDPKTSTKTSRSSSSCISSDNFLSVTQPGTDGDISDGISVISDCESVNDRHSPKLQTFNSIADNNVQEPRPCEDEGSRVEELDKYLMMDGPFATEDRNYIWNPTNIILLGVLVGLAAVFSTRCFSPSYDSLKPEMSMLTQRIQDLESENSALKVEVNRLVQLHHAGHEHPHYEETVHERVREKFPGHNKPAMKVKKVWTGADETPIRVPKYPVKEDFCDEKYLESDDLFANYNAKRCENKDNDEPEEETVQFDDRKKRNLTKDDGASQKRHKFSESKKKNDRKNSRDDSEEPVRNDKFAKIQEERQKIYDEAREKYVEKQKKFEKRQEKDKKHRDDVLSDQRNKPRKQPKDKDEDSEWYGKMMKQREELRGKGATNAGTKQQNKENWYVERANEREKVRRNQEKASKVKQFR